MTKKNIKVITGKIGLDDHYRGIISITEALRNAGMEVVYMGAGQRFNTMIKAIIQEDADVVGLSFLCGGHVEIMRRFMSMLKENNLNHVLVIIGGVIPDQDVAKLKELGVAEVFLPGTPLRYITDYVSQNVKN